ncbi:MAG: M81 family metallopeptidase [Terriglobales bacterium]
MRVAVGGIFHESNTFFSQPMTMERFAESSLDYGKEIFRKWRGTCSELAGFLDAAQQFDFEVAPTLMAWGMPAGAVTDEAFETLSSELLARLQAAAPLDGVLLSVHGAMVSDSFEDADGELLRRVRATIGDIPLVVTLDFHANLTEEMVRWPDALIGYDTYPHIDQVQRAVEAATLLNRMLRDELRPKMILMRRPMLPHILAQGTEHPPMADIIAAAHAAEQSPGVLSVTVCAGFPYTDVCRAGFAVIGVGETREAAFRAAESVANLAWSRRAEFARSIPTAAEAVCQAVAQPDGLNILVDVGDNVGGGTPGDGTVLLAELLRQNAQSALVLICDPESVAQCLAVGVRNRFAGKVGGKCDRHHGDPVEIVGNVRLLHDGIYRNVGPMFDGLIEDQGRTAVVDTGGVLVVLTERRMPMWNLQQLGALGIDPTRLRIIVVKAAIAYRAAYAPIASRIIEVDTPGLTAADVRRFTYHRLERPMYPLDCL